MSHLPLSSENPDSYLIAAMSASRSAVDERGRAQYPLMAPDWPKEQNNMDRKIEAETEAKKKEKTKVLLAVVFGGLIVALITVMFFIDSYAESVGAAPRQVHDAAEP